nr:MAG: nonstructural protein [Salisharnavirus sp.]
MNIENFCFLCSRLICYYYKHMSSEQGIFKNSNMDKRGPKKENWYARNRKMCTKREVKEEKSAKRAGYYYKTELSKLSPQLGIEALSTASFALESLARFSNINLPDNLTREVEGVLLLMVSLSQQNTEIGVISTVLTWVQGRTTKSLFGTIKNYVSELLIVPQSTVTPDWLDCIRDIRQNWQLCKSNRAFRQLSKLLGCLVNLGLCDITSLPFDVSKYELFSDNLLTKHMGALDIVDALFETVVYFTEGAYLCFQTGSLKPLLINDKTTLELDAEFAHVNSMFDLVKNGNLRKFKNITDHEFEARMNRLSSSLQNLSLSLKGLDKKLIMDKYQTVLNMQNNYVAMKISSGIRHAPWAIQLFGESSQGKTTMADQLLDAVLFSQNMSTDREHRCSYNPGDKYMSNWKSDKLVMIFDDISNEKSNFVERPPTRAILDVINNQAYYANKAEIDAKGKCFVEPWIVCATTNTKDLDAGYYSNCPYSIQRRLVSITVRAKRQFQRIENGVPCGIDPAKVRALYTQPDGTRTLPLFDDIWSLDIERAVKPKRLDLVARYEPIVWKGKKMVNISMKECIQWAIEDFDEHIKNQEALMEGMRYRDTCLERCPHEGCKHLKDNCPNHRGEPLEPHFGLETIGAFRRLWYDGSKSRIDKLYDKADKDFGNYIYSSGIAFLTTLNWVKALPRETFNNSYICGFILWLADDRVNWKYWWMKIFKNFFIFILSIFILLFLPVGCWIIFFYALKRWNDKVNTALYSCAEYSTLIQLKRINYKVTPVVRRCRDQYMRRICELSVGIAALYGLARAYKAYRRNQLNSQGSLEPKTQNDVDNRDAEANVWTSVVKRDLPISDISKRMSPEHLDNILKKSLLYVTIHSDENGMANALALSSNVILMPHHYFDYYGDVMNCTFRRNNPESSGGKFVARLDIDYSYLLPNSDLRVCYIPNGGSFKNIVNLFPTQEMPSVPFKLMWRDKSGIINEGTGITQPGVQTTYRDFVGGSYKNFNVNTFGGLCGAVLRSHTNGSTILGVHVGGTSGTPIGVYNSILQQDLHHAFGYLRGKEGVILSGSAGKFETVILDTQIMKDDPLHRKSPLNYMPENSQVMYHGSCIGRSTSKSEVVVTPISPIILDVCGVPNIYIGPKFKPDWYGWQVCLSNLAVPALPYPPRLLERAIIDYKSGLEGIFSSAMWSKATPLSDKDNICGVPGRKFLDPIKTNTAIGFPLVGPKLQYICELEPTDDHPNNREFIQPIMAEIRRLEDCYRRGERGYPIAKACKKDEILAKEKCRIFYSNSISLTFLVRKYYLPILRVLQMNPLKSECAVGINAHSQEWDQFYKHATQHGLDRIIGGDYGKYDQKLPSQLIFAALRILIDFARLCDYSKEDLDIMEALCGDIVFAYIAFNGDLISLTEGTHISGNSLTVIINGICGSLNMRCYYYSNVQREKPFRDNVALMTYGDDNIGSVAPGVDDFTIKGCSEFLEKYGQVYTMPDKESELLDFLPFEDFEFLKRKNVYHPRLDCNVGALVDKSIYKSLHCVLRGKNSPITMEQACSINIDGALREWFNHGEDVYENNRILMREVASQAGIAYMCNGLDLTYDQRVALWKEQYGSDPQAF